MHHDPKLLVLLATVIGLLLRLVKDPTLLGAVGLPSLPKKWVPLTALVLGGVAGFLASLQTGADLVTSLTAALEGLFAGSFAVAGHEVLVERGRGEK
jgi:hypothetical protein